MYGTRNLHFADVLGAELVQFALLGLVVEVTDKDAARVSFSMLLGLFNVVGHWHERRGSRTVSLMRANRKGGMDGFGH